MNTEAEGPRALLPPHVRAALRRTILSGAEIIPDDVWNHALATAGGRGPEFEAILAEFRRAFEAVAMLPDCSIVWAPRDVEAEPERRPGYSLEDVLGLLAAAEDRPLAGPHARRRGGIEKGVRRALAGERVRDPVVRELAACRSVDPVRRCAVFAAPAVDRICVAAKARRLETDAILSRSWAAIDAE